MDSTPYEMRLVNPGRRSGRTRKSNPGRKRRLTLKQKLHFGTARQRAAAKASLSGHRKRRRSTARASNPAPLRRRKRKATTTKRGAYKHVRKHAKRAKRRRTNVGRIATFSPARTSNPGHKKRSKKRSYTTMARTRKRKGGARRRSYGHRRRTTRRRNPSSLRSLLSSLSRRRSPRRRRNYGHRKARRYGARRRNPGTIQAAGMNFISIFGGGALTAMIMNKLVPPTWQTGWMGYIATAIVAFAQGKLVAMVLKKPALGNMLAMGGYVYLGFKVANDMVPSLMALSPYGLRGALARSSFYVPQVTSGNSFTSFVAPAAMSSAIAAGTASLRGRSGRLN